MAGTIFDELFGQGNAMGGKDSSTPEGDTVALDLPSTIVAGLKKEARRAHQSASTLLARIAAEYLEDLADARIVAKRRAEPRVPASEVFRRNGLEG